MTSPNPITTADYQGPLVLRARPNVERFRHEAFNAVEAISERQFTVESLEGCIKTMAVHVVDLADYIAHLERVAHAAWHLLDDSGESDDEGIHIHSSLHSERLSAALDTLEANGWKAHDDG